MPSYKLTYFDIQGLAEPIRLLLSYGGQEFEDIRLEYGGDEWPKLKPNTPFGRMPILEIEGKSPLHQHLAISRYLAKQNKLVGNNDWEDLQIDAIVDTLCELKQKLSYWAPFPEVVTKNNEEIIKATSPDFEKLNTLAVSGYLANEKLSWADLYFFSFQELFNTVAKSIFVDRYPNLKKVCDNVAAIPKIKEWIHKRPKADY